MEERYLLNSTFKQNKKNPETVEISGFSTPISFSVLQYGRSVGIRTRGLLDPNRRTMRYNGLRQQPRIRITQDGKRLDSTNFLMFSTQILYHKSVPKASIISQKAHKSVRFFLLLCAACASRKRSGLAPAPWICSYYRPSSCFFFASNSSWVITPLSSSSLYFLIWSASSLLGASTTGAGLDFSCCLSINKPLTTL